MSSRETFEVSEQAEIQDFLQFDNCPHGLYPGEDDCMYPAAPKVLLKKWKQRREDERADLD